MTTADFADVTVSTVMSMGDQGVVSVVLRWSTDDPELVQLQFRTTPAPVEWEAARSLIAEGLQHPAGIGDIRFNPNVGGDDEIGVRLIDHKGGPDCLLTARRDDLEQFVQRTGEYLVLYGGVEIPETVEDLLRVWGESA